MGRCETLFYHLSIRHNNVSLLLSNFASANLRLRRSQCNKKNQTNQKLPPDGVCQCLIQTGFSFETDNFISKFFVDLFLLVHFFLSNSTIPSVASMARVLFHCSFCFLFVFHWEIKWEKMGKSTTMAKNAFEWRNNGTMLWIAMPLQVNCSQISIQKW